MPDDRTPADNPPAGEDVSVGSLLAQAHREDIAASTRAQAPTAPGDDEGDPEPLAPPEPEESDDGITDDDSDEEEPEQSPEGEPTAEEIPPGDGAFDALAGWGAVIAEQPGRIAEVPAPHRKAVLENAFERVRAASVSEYVTAAQKVMADTGDALNAALRQQYEQGLHDGRNGVLAEADFAELESIRDNDPAAWAELSKNEPDKVARFLARNQQVAAEPELKRGMEEFTRRIARYPEARDYLVAKEQREPGRYNKANPAGMANLLSDVDEAIEWAIERRSTSGTPPNGAAGGGAPAQAPAPKGERVPAKVRSLPKPVIGGGQPARGEEQLPDDVGELLRMDYRETQKRRAQG